MSIPFLSGFTISWKRAEDCCIYNTSQFFKDVFSNVEGPQLGCFFVLVLFHALEDVGQDGDGFDNVRAFIEHDTFRPFAHGGVGDFRP